MTKKSSASVKTKPSPKPEEKSVSEQSHGYDSDSAEGTFSGWLRSGEGVQLMKMFVIGNSIIVFLTMSWPHLKQGINIAYAFFTGNDDEDLL